MTWPLAGYTKLILLLMTDAASLDPFNKDPTPAFASYSQVILMLESQIIALERRA